MLLKIQSKSYIVYDLTNFFIILFEIPKFVLSGITHRSLFVHLITQRYLTFASILYNILTTILTNTSFAIQTFQKTHSHSLKTEILASLIRPATNCASYQTKSPLLHRKTSPRNIQHRIFHISCTPPSPLKPQRRRSAGDFARHHKPH